MNRLLFLLFLVGALLLIIAASLSRTNRETSLVSKPDEAATSNERKPPSTEHILPLQVQKCLESQSIKGRVDVLFAQNPYFLRGDFDGDNRPDYAVAVRGRESKRNGVLICHGGARPMILGVDNSVKFSDMPDDNFISSNWDVFTKEDARTVRKSSGTSGSTPSAYPKGESIAMIWEDGICLIYWDASRYRWACGQ